MARLAVVGNNPWLYYWRNFYKAKKTKEFQRFCKLLECNERKAYDLLIRLCGVAYVNHPKEDNGSLRITCLSTVADLCRYDLENSHEDYNYFFTALRESGMLGNTENTWLTIQDWTNFKELYGPWDVILGNEPTEEELILIGSA